MSLLGRGRAAAGPGRRLDHRHRDRDVVGDRHPRGIAGTPAHRARRGRRHLALRDDARLDDLADLGLSRQWRNPDAARLGHRADRPLPGFRSRRRLHDGGGRQRQSVSPAVRRDRPAGPCRGSAVSHQRRPRRQPPGADPDPDRYFRGPRRWRSGPSGSMRPVSRTARSRPSTRWSADAQTAALGIIQQWLEAPSCRWSGCRCPSTAPARRLPRRRPRLGEDNPEIVDRTA